MSRSPLLRYFTGPGREQVHSVDPMHEPPAELTGVEKFQTDVSNRFHDLASADDDELLSLGWKRKILDAYISCQDDFRVLLLDHQAQLSKPPLDHAITEYLDKNLKALDICNAIRDGIEKVRQWGNQIEVVLRALNYQQKGTFSEPQFRRAKKALMEMALMMLDEKEGGSVLSNRNRSFGRHNASKDNQNRRPGHSRSLSWSVSRSWSASKQLQAIANNLVPPQRNEPLATAVFLMSCVRLFVLWVLVAAIPCQDRGLQCSFPNLRQFYWGASLHLLHNRILDESKRRDKRNSHGLLKEITNLEKLTRKMTDLVDSAEFPLEDSQKAELVQEIEQLAAICGVLKSGLEPLEVQVREVFKRIMNHRIEFLEFIPDSNAG
ncbi:hypothetical protein Droror1_Dr00005607 [Drosera rotundifolia]